MMGPGAGQNWTSAKSVTPTPATIEPMFGMKLRMNDITPQTMGKSTPIQVRSSPTSTPVARLMKNLTLRYRATCLMTSATIFCIRVDMMPAKASSMRFLKWPISRSRNTTNRIDHDRVGEEPQERFRVAKRDRLHALPEAELAPEVLEQADVLVVREAERLGHA